MAETNTTNLFQYMSVILVQPQMGENIGAAARIMSNFGLRDLRIVAPRDGWPNTKAEDTARNAKFIVDAATIYPDLRAATHDLQHLFATTSRSREMVKPCLTPRLTAAECQKFTRMEERCGLVFGPERSGLTNEDTALCDAIVTIPVSTDNASLNLAQAVAILCYEWFVLQEDSQKVADYMEKETTATRGEVDGFFGQLESALDNADYFKVPEKRDRMLINIRNMFLRARMTDQEVRTLRGMLASLEKH